MMPSSADSYVGPAYTAGEIHCPGCACVRPETLAEQAQRLARESGEKAARAADAVVDRRQGCVLR